MATLGQEYVARCLAYAGRVVEATGNNDGPQIEAWQREAEQVYERPAGEYRGAPWCAIGAGCVAREAKVTAAFPARSNRLWHPYTGFIVDQADEMGGLYPDSSVAPPGSLIVRGGVHVGVVVYDRQNGWLDTVEFNAGNAVSRLVRSKNDWRIVVPPGIEQAGKPQWVDSFGFDDLTMKPNLLGGWRTQEIREEKLAGFLEHRPGWWTRRVRFTAKAGEFAFWTGPPGTWESDWAWWEYGGWTGGGDLEVGRRTREEQIERFADRFGHRNVRRWRRRVPVPYLGIDDRSGVIVAADGISTR